MLEGSLKDFALSEVLHLLAQSGSTGVLVVEAEDLTGHVHVRDGAITTASTSAAGDALGAVLLAAGLVHHATIEAAITARDEHGGVARAIEAIGGLDAERVRAVERERVQSAVFALLRSHGARFRFSARTPPQEPVGEPLSVEEVVAEALRRLEHWQELGQRIPLGDAVVTLAPEAPGDVDVVVPRQAWPLLAQVDGRRTVSDLVDLVGTGEWATVRALAELVDQGLVVVGAPHADTRWERARTLARRERGAAAAAGHLPAWVHHEVVLEAEDVGADVSSGAAPPDG